MNASSKLPVIRLTAMFAVFALLAACSVGLVGCQSEQNGQRSQADHPKHSLTHFEPVTATTLDGQPFKLTTSDHIATALIFLLPDCPIANGYSPEITRLHQAYKDKGIRFVLVYSDRDITIGNAKTHHADFRHTSDAVIDPKLSLAKLTGATITPEAVVLSAKGAVLYRGRIDDRFPDYGKRRAIPTATELRDALDAVVDGKPIKVARSKAVGCFLDVK